MGHNMGHTSQQRKKLFENDLIQQDLFVTALDSALDRAQQEDITELTESIDRQQL